MKINKRIKKRSFLNNEIASGSDLKFIFAIAITVVLYGAFNVIYFTNKLETGALPSNNNDTGIFGSLSFDFLDPIKAMFTGDVLLINIFIFSVLIFALIIVAYRQIRGI